MGFLDKTGVTTLVSILQTKFQEKLVSGTNIKTINDTSLLGSGNIDIQGGASGFVVTFTVRLDGWDEVTQSDKTFQEIKDALDTGVMPTFVFHDTRGTANDYYYTSLNVFDASGPSIRLAGYMTTTITGSSMNDYPTRIVSDGN